MKTNYPPSLCYPGLLRMSLLIIAWIMILPSLYAEKNSTIREEGNKTAMVNKSCIITGPALVCPGEQIVYSVSSPAINPVYNWTITGDAVISGSATGSSVTVVASLTGSYLVTVEVMDSTNCGESAIVCEMETTIITDPVINAGPDQALCIEEGGAEFILSGSVSAGTATWTVISGTAIIANPNSLTTTVIVTSPSAVLKLTSDSPILCGTCKAFAHDEVVLTVNPSPECIISLLNPDELVCNGGNYTIATTLDPDLYDFLWTLSVDGNPDGWEIIGSGTGQELMFSAGDCGPVGFEVTVTLQVTDEATGCISICESSFAPRAPLCIVDIRPPVELNCLITSQYLLAVYSTDIINPEFEWTLDGVSIGAGINDGSGLDSILITEAGTYVFTITDPENPSNVCSAEVTVLDNEEAPECLITGDAPDCLNLTQVYSAPAAPQGVVYTYTWTVTGDAVIEGDTDGIDVIVTATDACESEFTLFLTITDSESNCESVCQAFFSFADTTAPVIGEPGDDMEINCPATPEFTAPTATDDCDESPEVIQVGTDSTTNNDGSVTYVRTWIAVDNCGNESAAATQTITVIPCAGPVQYCTQTQGFYGNEGGVTCVTGEGTLELLERILDAPFGALVIGEGGRTLTITEAECVIEILPGGGTPAILPSGNHTLNEECELEGEEEFMNVLVGQTIALGLNMRLDPDLLTLELSGEIMLTSDADAGEDGLCGNEDDVPTGGGSPVEFSDDVLDALDQIYGSRTVADLFNLANRALGGLPTGDASLSEINDAVSKINEAFLNCKFVDGFEDEAGPQLNNEIAAKAYPNPFTENITIEFVSPKDDMITVEIYNLNGSKVATIFAGEVEAGKVKVLKYAATDLPAGIYTYTITGDDNSFREKIILTK